MTRPFQELDHLAIVVPDTEEALRMWRDQFGLEVVLQEIVNNGTVRLTHLDLSNTHLQLVEPLVPEHPLRRWLDLHGPGLHHLCFRVEDIDAAAAALDALGFPPTSSRSHQGTEGRRALFLVKDTTQGVQVEVTGVQP